MGPFGEETVGQIQTAEMRGRGWAYVCPRYGVRTNERMVRVWSRDPREGNRGFGVSERVEGRAKNEGKR